MTRPQPFVIGATGMVGGAILRRLIAEGAQPVGLSRQERQPGDGVRWVAGDLADLGGVALPPIDVVFATAPVGRVADAVPALAAAGMSRLVVFTSTSIETKWDTPDPDERAFIRDWGAGEARVIAACAAHGVGCTVLRPTLIYLEGRDRNVSRIAGLIRRFRFFPLMAGGEGLRQPVHADDLAAAAVAAAERPQAIGKIYNLPGGETLSYREMVGRIFDGLGLPRIIVPVPDWVWRMILPVAVKVLPGLSATMATRMAKDMTFDAGPAAADLGFRPRPFRPRFRS
ncbi:NAD-dependent epimerase/dehydratase family protein [Rhodopseudomonas sp. WA056]|uniref:NAD-dependent epimerase/dehydratase n=1 Tax=Rhodopseudomonas palustris (strain DX-1) TaxID=652103 RepID=E6VM73_RHOPX|nr:MULTISPECIES: NAD-dependent epimerase/dehydratase family protein [Rhodopseudomonas]NEW86655.1 NAD-dependent epimerase/dehydratase family protein [Rhodopseudomonas sp. WA056]QDL98607.1 NAD-dependent epimerase/dehydratase family protein [Rhodopseudomonas palustris]